VLDELQKCGHGRLDLGQLDNDLKGSLSKEYTGTSGGSLGSNTFNINIY
jgi:hypothetical protein